MTTDTQLAPTDDEIDALNDQHRWDTTEGRRDLARAVLARWGTQSTHYSAAEFALQALVAAGHVSQELVDRALALPDAPLSVFSKGPWTFKETGQSFSGAELDEAAFVAYRDRASHGQAPAQAAPPEGTARCSECSGTGGSWSVEHAWCPKCDGSGQLPTPTAQAADSVLEDAHALLQEVAACFTRDDDLPDNLLPRIDAVLAARARLEEKPCA